MRAGLFVPRYWIEESFKLKRKLLFLLLAVVPAAFAPVRAAGQVNPEAAPVPHQARAYKYEVYAGLAYTRLRQVPVSYSGLLGGKVSLARNWGKYFQLMASADEYRLGTGHAGLPNPGHPTVYTFLVGPESTLRFSEPGRGAFRRAGRRAYRKREHDTEHLLCRRFWWRVDL